MTDFSPISALKSLKELSLIRSAITDLAPIAGLFSLERLYLNQTGIIDLVPLAGLATLQDLWLDQTNITDLAPLANLRTLQSLSLSQTAVSDLAPLAHLSTLRALRLDQTAVTDLAPLAKLSRLWSLRLDQTNVSDLTPLAGLTAMVVLVINQTAVSDLAPLGGLSELQSLMLSQTAVKDLMPLAGLNKLQGLYLSQTPVSDLAPLAGLQALVRLSLTDTDVVDLSPLSQVSTLADLDVVRSGVTDLRPIRHLSKLATGAWTSGFGEANFAFRSTPATARDAELARLAEITDGNDRARQTLAYLNTLPPWPEPYTPRARPDGKPPQAIGRVAEPRSTLPALRTPEAQIGALLRHAIVTRVTAAQLADQIAIALRGLPASDGNQLPPILQLMSEVGEVLDMMGRTQSTAMAEERNLRLRLAQLEMLVERLTTALKNSKEATMAAEALAAKDGFLASYKKSLGTSAGVATAGIVTVGVPTAAIYFLGVEHPLVQALLTAVGRLPK